MTCQYLRIARKLEFSSLFARNGKCLATDAKVAKERNFVHFFPPSFPSCPLRDSAFEFQLGVRSLLGLNQPRANKSYCGRKSKRWRRKNNNVHQSGGLSRCRWKTRFAF